jgi:hypothetical protein
MPVGDANGPAPVQKARTTADHTALTFGLIVQIGEKPASRRNGLALGLGGIS